MKQLRQGDVLLERLDGLDLSEAVRESADDAPVILAEGEKTGHTHSIDGPGAVLWYHFRAGLILEVTEPADLNHQEHGSVRLEPGLYRIRYQREYVDEGKTRDVAD